VAALTPLMRDLRQIFLRDAEQNAIPPMDGPLSPNDRLDACQPIGEPLVNADDVALGPDGAIYVSGGRSVLRLAGEGFAERSVFAEFQADTGALALHPDGRVLVAVAGRGLAAVEAYGRTQWLSKVDGQALRCLAAMTVGADGTIFAVEGSARHLASDWSRDLMEKNRSGRLLITGPELDRARVLLRGLLYPHGIALGDDGQSLWLAESWSHSVSRVPLRGDTVGRPERVLRNLPGYPARVRLAVGGGFWLCLFAVRTHLVEFVLREDEFRDEMMRTIDPRYWVAPALSSGDDCLEPMQIGSVKALGIQKPWAPPRSYGLLARVEVHPDGTCELVESLHSRVGGQYHGITSCCETPQGLVIVSKGSGRLLLARSRSMR
jgi:sugar lactone lactonase YvrE